MVMMLGFLEQRNVYNSLKLQLASQFRLHRHRRRRRRQFDGEPDPSEGLYLPRAIRSSPGPTPVVVPTRRRHTSPPAGPGIRSPITTARNAGIRIPATAPSTTRSRIECRTSPTARATRSSPARSRGSSMTSTPPFNQWNRFNYFGSAQFPINGRPQGLAFEVPNINAPAVDGTLPPRHGLPDPDRLYGLVLASRRPKLQVLWRLGFPEQPPGRRQFPVRRRLGPLPQGLPWPADLHEPGHTERRRGHLIRPVLTRSQGDPSSPRPSRRPRMSIREAAILSLTTLSIALVGCGRSGNTTVVPRRSPIAGEDRPHRREVGGGQAGDRRQGRDRLRPRGQGRPVPSKPRRRSADARVVESRTRDDGSGCDDWGRTGASPDPSINPSFPAIIFALARPWRRMIREGRTGR